MRDKSRIGPAESSRMMDAEQWLPVSMRPDRQQRLQIRADWTTIGQTFGESLDRRRFKQAADRYLNFKARPQPADQARRQKRVTTKRKEVILNPDPLNPQYLRTYTAPHLLARRARQPNTPPTNRRRRQRRPVKLPVRRQRKPIK